MLEGDIMGSEGVGVLAVVLGGVIMPDKKLAGLTLTDLVGVCPRLLAKSDRAPNDESRAFRQLPIAATAAMGSARGDCVKLCNEAMDGN